MTSHRFEVILWGVRGLRKVHYMTVSNPIIVLECNGHYVKSEVMENCRKFSNFEKSHVTIDLVRTSLLLFEQHPRVPYILLSVSKDLPELDVYYPSLTIKAYDSRCLGCLTYLGVAIVPTIYGFVEQLVPEDEYFDKIVGKDLSKDVKNKKVSKKTIRKYFFLPRIILRKKYKRDFHSTRSTTSWQFRSWCNGNWRTDELQAHQWKKRDFETFFVLRRIQKYLQVQKGCESTGNILRNRRWWILRLVEQVLRFSSGKKKNNQL